MMQNKKKEYGLLFDMDNTILASKIDFARMKREIIALVRRAVPQQEDFSAFSVGQVIDWGARHGMTEETRQKAWQRVAELETAGMLNAKAEPGFLEMVETLQQTFHLSILTNNAMIAAQTALEHALLTPYFHDLYARESAKALKPSPSGVLLVKANNPHVKRWLLVGDSWLDGQAAQNAAMPFAAYGEKPESYWQDNGVTPDVWIKNWDVCGVSSIYDWFF